jgi:hypothetical protein
VASALQEMERLVGDTVRSNHLPILDKTLGLSRHLRFPFRKNSASFRLRLA